ncbi:hypothetical protein [Streptomyces sp. NPDC051572]
MTDSTGLFDLTGRSALVTGAGAASVPRSPRHWRAQVPRCW